MCVCLCVYDDLGYTKMVVRSRPYTFGPFAAEAVSRERKTTKGPKDMDRKGLDVRSVGEWEETRWSSLVAAEAANESVWQQKRCVCVCVCVCVYAYTFIYTYMYS